MTVLRQELSTKDIKIDELKEKLKLTNHLSTEMQQKFDITEKVVTELESRCGLMHSKNKSESTTGTQTSWRLMHPLFKE